MIAALNLQIFGAMILFALLAAAGALVAGKMHEHARRALIIVASSPALFFR
jgi:hypothetical protein